MSKINDFERAMHTPDVGLVGAARWPFKVYSQENRGHPHTHVHPHTHTHIYIYPYTRAQTQVTKKSNQRGASLHSTKRFRSCGNQMQASHSLGYVHLCVSLYFPFLP